jgi:DNA modification methylase
MERFAFSSQIEFRDDVGKIKDILRFNNFYPKLEKNIYSTIRRRNKTLKDGTKKYKVGDKYLVHINNNFNHIAQIIELKKVCLTELDEEFLKEDTNTNSREEAYELLNTIYNRDFNFDKKKFIIIRLRKVKINILTELEICKLPYITLPKRIMNNTIVLGDFFRIEKLIQNKTFQFIVLDPPFNISQKRVFTRKNVQDINLYFGKWDDFGKGIEGFKNYLKYMYNLLERIYRLIRVNGSLAVFCSDRVSSYIRFYLKFILNMKIKGSFIWCKTNPAPRFLKNSFANATEFCILAQKSEKSVFNFLGQKKMRNWEKTPTVLGEERLKDKNGHTLHPNQKSKKLIRKFIRIFSNRGDLIADFMAGTFTTSVVAKEEGRKFFGIEKKYRYFKYSKERVIKAKRKSRQKLKRKNKCKIKFQNLKKF